jgi:hypothetical protein
MKVLHSLVILCFISSLLLSAQNAYRGTLTLTGNTPLQGAFDKKIDKNTRVLSFIDDSGKNYNVLSLDGAMLYFEDTRDYFITQGAKGNTQLLKVIINGDARLYQSLKGGRTYVENIRLKTGTVEIFPGSDPRSLNSNRGKLLVVFQDCLAARERTNDSPTTMDEIKSLVRFYNDCDTYNKDFELTKKEQTAQKYADKTSIVHFDAGLGIFFLNNDIGLSGEDLNYSANDKATGLSVFASVNFSPNYLYSLMDKLYFNVSLQYNFKSSLEFEEVSQDFSNLNLMFAPRYYFGNSDSKIRPYLGFGVGMGLLNFQVEDLSNSRFENFDDSIIQFMYAFQAGVLITDHFELSIEYFPYFNYSTFIQPEEIRYKSTFDSVLIKLAYRF